MSSVTTRRRHVLQQKLLLNNDSATCRLPNELLAEVLLSGYGSHSSRSARLDFLKTVTSVCLVWRDAAITTASLWTDIFYENNARSEFRVGFHRLQEFLRRSRNASIDISLNMGSRTSKQNEARVLRLSLSHISHCRPFDVFCPHAGTFTPFMPLRGAMNRLEVLNIRFHIRDTQASTSLFTDENVSPLRRLFINFVDSHLLKSVPTSELRYINLTVRVLSWSDILRFISQCQVAEAISLATFGHFERVTATGATYSERFSLPRLKRLHITDDMALRFSRFMATPSLEELTITCDAHAIRLLGSSLLIQPLPPHTLTLSNFHRNTQMFHNQSLRRIFGACSRTQILKIAVFDQFDAVIAALLGIDDMSPNDPVTSEPLLPALTLLHFQRPLVYSFLGMSPWIKVARGEDSIADRA